MRADINGVNKDEGVGFQIRCHEKWGGDGARGKGDVLMETTTARKDEAILFQETKLPLS